MGYGEISILLALARRTGTSPETIMQMRQSGMGWGQIAQQLKVKLGPLISGVKAAEKGVGDVAKADSKHPERVGKVEKDARPDKLERMEIPDEESGGSTYSAR